MTMDSVPLIEKIRVLLVALAIAGLSGGSASAMTIAYSDTRLASTPVVMVVNQDQFEGNWKQFKGDLKKKWGKFTDDDLLVIEGNYDKFEGRLQERYGDKKEDVNRWTDEWFKKHPEKTKKGR